MSTGSFLPERNFPGSYTRAAPAGGVNGVDGGIIYSSRRVTIAVFGEGIRVWADIYGRLIPAKDLLLDEARAADLTREGSLAFRWKTNGAVCHRSEADRLHSDVGGYSLLVSVENPNALIANARTELR